MSNVAGASDQKRQEVATIFASSEFLSCPFSYSRMMVGKDRVSIKNFFLLSEIQDCHVFILGFPSSWFDRALFGQGKFLFRVRTSFCRVAVVSRLSCLKAIFDLMFSSVPFIYMLLVRKFSHK